MMFTSTARDNYVSPCVTPEPFITTSPMCMKDFLVFTDVLYVLFMDIFVL